MLIFTQGTYIDPAAATDKTQETQTLRHSKKESSLLTTPTNTCRKNATLMVAVTRPELML